MKRRLMESAAPWAGWDMLLCSASDGGEGEGGEGGGGSGDDDPVKKLTAKVDEILGEKKKLAEKVRAFEAAEAERKADLAKREEEESRKKGEWDKIEAGYKEKISTAEGEGLLWKAKYFEREMDLGLTNALDQANVKPELRKAAMALLRSNADIDDDGNITLGDKPLADAMKAWAASDEGKAFISNGAAGGGANGGGGNGKGGDKNPWSKEHFSLTEQGKIYKADPNRARELARAAGAVPPG